MYILRDMDFSGSLNRGKLDGSEEYTRTNWEHSVVDQPKSIALGFVHIIA